jgi:apolipoprotein N-acyltransferase
MLMEIDFLVNAGGHHPVHTEGRLIAQKSAAPSGMTVLIAALPPGPGPTFYTRIGDAFPWSIVALFVGIGVLCIAKSRSGATFRAG